MSMDTDERTATALERIADALERAHPVEYRRTGLGAAWDACEVAEGYLDGLGAARPNGNDSMASPDALGQIMTAIEAGCDMVTASLGLASNPQKTAEAMRAAVAMLRETVMRYTMTEADGLTSWALIPDEADPLDEDDHRPRHFPDGEHLRRYACGHWHMATRDRCNEPDHGDGYTLAWWDEPLTFCDCP